MKYLVLLLSLIVFPASSYGYTLSGASDHIPWSGYWWPVHSGELLLGYGPHFNPSPCEKYDLVTYGFYPSTLTAYGSNPINKVYNSSAPSWWGFCHAWANAAVSEPIDFAPSVVNGTFLSVGDKKGLLTLVHRDDPQVYDVCNNEPLVFHKFLLEYIGEDKLALVADMDCSEEVWSHPIYEYTMKIVQNTNYDGVTCTIKYVSDYVAPDYIGTVTLTKELTYNLYKNDQDEYISSEWGGASIDDHPDSIWLPVGQYFDDDALSYDQVKRLVLSTGDSVVEKATVGLNLLIGGAAARTIDLHDFDGAHRKIYYVLDTQSSLDSLHIGLIIDGTEEESLTITKDLASLDLDKNKQYSLVIPGYDSASVPYIRLYYDVSLEHTYYFECVPQNYEWVGIAMSSLNPGDDNQVLGTYVYGNKIEAVNIVDISLNKNASTSIVPPNERFFDYYFNASVSGIKISSANELDVTLLKGQTRSMCGPSTNTISENTLVIPKLTSSNNLFQSTNLFLVNDADKDADLDIEYISSSIGSSSVAIGSDTINYYKAGHYPNDIDVNGWGVLKVNEAATVHGSIVNTIVSTGVYQLPLIPLAKRFILPHCAMDEIWKTGITLFNPGSDVLNCNLFLHYSDGGSLKREYSIDSKTNLTIDVKTLERVEDLSWIDISADEDFSGYFTYDTTNTKTTLPLLTEGYSANRLRLSHVASDFEWWTGLVLLNDTSNMASVTMFAYDGNGDFLDSTALNISAESKYVNTISSAFSVDPSKIATVYIYSDVKLCGFNLYGDKFDRKYLSGKVLNAFN